MLETLFYKWKSYLCIVYITLEVKISHAQESNYIPVYKWCQNYMWSMFFVLDSFLPRKCTPSTPWQSSSSPNRTTTTLGCVRWCPCWDMQAPRSGLTPTCLMKRSDSVYFISDLSNLICIISMVCYYTLLMLKMTRYSGFHLPVCSVAFYNMV